MFKLEKYIVVAKDGSVFASGDDKEEMARKAWKYGYKLFEITGSKRIKSKVVFED